MSITTPRSLIDQCRIIELPKIPSTRGSLTFIESEVHLPFMIERVYYLYDVPGGESRGGHAHKSIEQFIIAASGSFDVVVKDGEQSRSFSLRRSWYGLYVPVMLWRELVEFSSASVCLVMASAHYDEGDYIRDWDEYRRAMPPVR
jgi:dTDP-4-dehydrorhamnose 3,5-epimerase-like enzyme